eukprot:jgi/Mesvir1/14660/Mv05328-RA.1
MNTPGNALLSLYQGGKAVPAKVANWVRESVGSCASGVGKTLKRDEMQRIVAAMYPALPQEFLSKAAKHSLCLLLGDEIVGRAISDLCHQGIAGGPDTRKRLIEITAILTKQPAAALLPLPREALCALASNASSTTQRAGALNAAKALDPLTGVDWSKVSARTSAALSKAARGGRAAFDASKVIGSQLYGGADAVFRSPITRAAGRAALAGGRMAGQAALAGGRMAGQAALAGGAMAGQRLMDAAAPPPFELHGLGQHRVASGAMESAHLARTATIAAALNPYKGVESRKTPKTSRALPRSANPYVGYGNAGHLGSKQSIPTLKTKAIKTMLQFRRHSNSIRRGIELIAALAILEGRDPEKDATTWLTSIRDDILKDSGKDFSMSVFSKLLADSVNNVESGKTTWAFDYMKDTAERGLKRKDIGLHEEAELHDYIGKIDAYKDANKTGGKDGKYNDDDDDDLIKFDEDERDAHTPGQRRYARKKHRPASAPVRRHRPAAKSARCSFGSKSVLCA